MFDMAGKMFDKDTLKKYAKWIKPRNVETP